LNKKTALWKYKRHQARVMRKNAKKRKRTSKLKQFHLSSLSAHTFRKSKNIEFPSIIAPKDFRFLDNIIECATFFKQLRSKNNVSIKNYRRYKLVSLQEIELIDFSAVLTLSAICKELKCNNIFVRGNFPNNPACSQFLIDSGFLDNKYDINGRMYHLLSRTKSMTFEQGQGKLLLKDLKNIVSLSSLITSYFGDNDTSNVYNLTLLFKEICANSIEWSDSYKRQWALAAKFEGDKVLVATIDLGQGILNSLERRQAAIIKDLFTFKTQVDILAGAFDKKYGSKSKDINRNKGLPSLKAAFERGVIKKLIVLTNNVMLSFDKWHDNCKFANTYDAFKGTMYFFEIDKSCLIA